MNNRKHCKGCGHYRFITGGTLGCNYCYDIGEPRGCPVEQCDKKTKKRYADDFENRCYSEGAML